MPDDTQPKTAPPGSPALAGSGTVKRSHQCQCCASPLGDLVRMDHTERVICLRCLGFIAAWLIELDHAPVTFEMRPESPND